MDTVVLLAGLSTDETPMESTADSNSHDPATCARLADLAHDARVLHNDLNVPLDEAAYQLVVDSDYVNPHEREEILTVLLELLD
jgi:hypothetical protein